MASQIAHRSIAEVPPAIPFRSRKIYGVEGPLRCRAKPQIPIQELGWWLGFGGPLDDPNKILMTFGVRLALPTPGTRYPNVSLVDRSDSPTLDEFDHLAI